MEDKSKKSLAFSQSPLCPLAVDVISDDESIYFYMYDLDYLKREMIPRSACWLKNLKEVVENFNKIDEFQEQQIALPDSLIEQSDYEEWNQEKIEIVWSKEGHMASVYYEDQLYAIIPDWADGIQFNGYTKNVKENTMVGWRLNDVINLFDSRFQESKLFWKQEFNEVWEHYHTPYVEELYKYFGHIKNCYDIHKDKFPSRLLLTFEKNGYIYGFTVGMGMFYMPNADRYYDDYESYAKCEFAFVYREDEYTIDEQLELYSSIANLCEYPWEHMECLADYHVLDIKFKNKMHCMIIDDDHFMDAYDFSIKKKGVHLSWLLPLSEDEFHQLKDHSKETIENIIHQGRIR